MLVRIVRRWRNVSARFRSSRLAIAG